MSSASARIVHATGSVGSFIEHSALRYDLADKEVIIIDKEEYVKVYNPSTSEGSPKYLYIPVNEYLAKKETYRSLSYRKEEPKKGSPSSTPPSA